MPPGSRQIEMTWRCSTCGHHNRGRDKSCAECGDPKDQSEKYEMPSSTATAATVTDESLLRMATAGPDWRCAYCGSDQRRLDGNCGRCGASASPAVATPVGVQRRLTAWQRVARWVRAHKLVSGIVGGVLAFIVLIVGLAAWHNRARDFQTTVAAVRWEHTITVERYRIWHRDGWRTDLPSAAFEVRSLGDKIHHYDDVLDGYDTQHYTEQVACGQDCTTEPRSCSEQCSDNGNGFASCHTSCTGGGRSCRTRYCSEPRTRQVARYRKEPRYAESIAYKIWDWGVQRAVHDQGDATAGLRWPIEAARVGADLAPREEEREVRSARYVVTLGYEAKSRVSFVTSAEQFPLFTVGSAHHLRLKGKTAAVDGQPVERTSEP